MKRIAIVVAVTVMAGCAPATDAAGPAEEVDETAGFAIAPGLYAVGDETTEYGQTRINADGTYIDMEGETRVGSGAWTAEGATMCMDPEGDGEGQQERCWINSAPDEDGSFITTREDGSQSYRVTPITE